MALFLVGLLVGCLMERMAHIMHLKIIVSKANTPDNRIGFIFGKPYVILHEKEYVEMLIAEQKRLKDEMGRWSK